MSLINVNFEWTLKRLELSSDIKPFKSDDKELNDFLTDDAKNYLSEMLAITYVIENDTETIAYFCLSNDNIKRDVDLKTWNKINRKIPNGKRKGSYPAVKIGRLAVTEKYAGNGFGRIMINIVKNTFLEDKQKSGCRFITVDAYQSALDFYRRNDFQFLTEKDTDKYSRAMYFDLKTIQQPSIE